VKITIWVGKTLQIDLGLPITYGQFHCHRITLWLSFFTLKCMPNKKHWCQGLHKGDWPISTHLKKKMNCADTNFDNVITVFLLRFLCKIQRCLQKEWGVSYDMVIKVNLHPVTEWNHGFLICTTRKWIIINVNVILLMFHKFGPHSAVQYNRGYSILYSTVLGIILCLLTTVLSKHTSIISSDLVQSVCGR
jgi:hypothetical protein